MTRLARLRGPVPGRTWAVVLLCWVATGCSVDEPTGVQKVAPGRPDAALAQGQAGESLTRWEALGDDSLWKHVEASRGVVDVGLRQPGQANGLRRGRVLVNAGHRAGGRAAVAGIRGVEVLGVDALLPILKLRVRNVEALARLRKLPHVEYVEPGAFTHVRGGRGLAWNDLELGCSTNGYAGPPINTWLTPGDGVPWNYRRMNIDSAWANGATGRGITVGVVDTGIDDGQAELNERFSTSWSAGRTITKEATKPRKGVKNSWDDTCGHGTRMASVVAAPRNGYGMLGVAWGANLYAVRVDDDVVLTEVEATRLGIRRAAEQSQVMTMAFGTWAYYTSIAQEIEYWYYNSDRVMFAAAGTYPCWDPVKVVSFPGTLSTVLTVAALDEMGGISCNSGRGYEVDFAAYTNQPAQGLGHLGPGLVGLGGSSGATAVLAGMTALYLESNPLATRSQVTTALIAAASPTGYRSPVTGFGAPNGVCLVGLMCSAWIEGPTLIQSSGTYSWSARQMGSKGTVTYTWDTGATTPQISRYVTVTPGMAEYTFSVTVTIRDTRNGRTYTVTKPVVVRDPYGCPTCA